MKETIKKQVNSELCSGIKDGATLLELARGWLKQGNPVVAIELLKSAIVSFEADRDKELRAQVLKEIGRAKMMQSDWESSETFYLESQQLFLSLDNYKGASECARNRANAYFQKGMYHKSEELCEQALEWASEINDFELRATVLNTLGAIKSATGDLKEALNISKLCLADFQSSGNKNRQGYVLLNIGLTQTELGEYDNAIASLNQSLAIALNERDLNLVEICYQNISKCYLAQKETHLAKSVIDTARKILPGLNSNALETELNLIDSKILKMMGDIEGAEQLLSKTYMMACKNKLTSIQADALLEQGLLEKDKGNIELALSKLDAAANHFKSIGQENGFKEAIKELNNLHRRVNV